MRTPLAWWCSTLHNAMASPNSASTNANAIELWPSTLQHARASQHSASDNMHALETGLSTLQSARTSSSEFNHTHHEGICRLLFNIAKCNAITTCCINPCECHSVLVRNIAQNARASPNYASVNMNAPVFGLSTLQHAKALPDYIWTIVNVSSDKHTNALALGCSTLQDSRALPHAKLTHANCHGVWFVNIATYKGITQWGKGQCKRHEITKACIKNCQCPRVWVVNISKCNGITTFCIRKHECPWARAVGIANCKGTTNLLSSQRTHAFDSFAFNIARCNNITSLMRMPVGVGCEHCNVGYSTSSRTRHRRLLDIVGYSTSLVTQHHQPCPQAK
jgi:hypothetical protein